MSFLRYGITTGACAAAAAKAALITLLDKPVERVGVPTPIGLRLEVPVEKCWKIGVGRAAASVIKDSGDDLDVTHGLRIEAAVKLTEDGKVVIKGGEGIGIVTKPGLPVAVGEPAINPVPRIMIENAVKEVLPPGKGVEVLLEVPAGKEIAEKTFNRKLGIVGGISILGTTGVVKPYSVIAYRQSLVPQIDVALASGHECLVLVPGNIGAKFAKQVFNVPEDAIVQTGDFVGYMLRKAVAKGARKIVLLGHVGKLVKLAAGIFNTHHKMGDARKEVIAAYAGAAGATPQLVSQILQANTAEDAATLLREAKLAAQTFNMIAEKIRLRCTEKVEGKAQITVILLSLGGEILGTSGGFEWVEKWRKST